MKPVRKTTKNKVGKRKRAAKAVTPKRRAAIQAPDNAEGRILAAIRRIPRGRVSTYGDIAAVAGLPGRARLVGTVLRQSPAERRLPWFRVINASGRSSLAVGSDGHLSQLRSLQAEGVEFRGGRVDLARFGWPARGSSLDEWLWKME
jgi:methylated-DNA-protein-cysteine methyltransferase-like protein